MSTRPSTLNSQPAPKARHGECAVARWRQTVRAARIRGWQNRRGQTKRLPFDLEVATR